MKSLFVPYVWLSGYLRFTFTHVPFHFESIRYSFQQQLRIFPRSVVYRNLIRENWSDSDLFTRPCRYIRTSHVNYTCIVKTLIIYNKHINQQCQLFWNRFILKKKIINIYCIIKLLKFRGVWLHSSSQLAFQLLVKFLNCMLYLYRV